MQEKLKRGTYIRDKEDAGEALFGRVFHVVKLKGEKTLLRVGYKVCTVSSSQFWIDRYKRKGVKLFYVDFDKVEVLEQPSKQETDYYQAITGE